MKRWAVFSPCRRYRYELWREWDTSLGYAMFVGLNPSTADETNDDPTVRRCIRFARDWGYGAMCMTNAFAFRATDPRVMKREPSPVGPENNHRLRYLASGAGVVVAAWGTHGVHLGQADFLRLHLPGLHILRLTKDGHPAHPLYLPADLTPQPWLEWRSVA